MFALVIKMVVKTSSSHTGMDGLKSWPCFQSQLPCEEDAGRWQMMDHRAGLSMWEAWIEFPALSFTPVSQWVGAVFVSQIIISKILNKESAKVFCASQEMLATPLSCWSLRLLALRF